jgi:hypothetical protein
MREDDSAWQPAVGQRVVCAANRFPCGTVVLGARHYDMLMHLTIEKLGLEPGDDEEGFIDQWGQFLTRTQAWKVAEAARQIWRRCGGDTADGGTLYSENLY